MINQAHGTYTQLPTLGQVIRQGHALYRVNDSPVVLLYGSTPAYRTLSAGATGPDVAELNADLVALGYATRLSSAQGPPSFGSATTTAVEKLQAALGVTRNGTLTLGQAVFEPTAVRVTTVSAQPGGSAQPGETVLQGTSTTRQVQVALDASQQTEHGRRGQGEHHPAQQPDHPGCRLLGGRRSPPAHRAPGRAGRDRAPPRPERTPARRGWTARRRSPWTSPRPTRPPRARGIRPRCRSASPPPACADALVVPVTALLARSSGGYSVEVVGAARGATVSSRSRSGCSTTPTGSCRSPARAWPPARKWWSRQHDRHPVTHTRQHRVAAGTASPAVPGCRCSSSTT